MANAQDNYYTNPAFCQQSEYYAGTQGRCNSPPKAISPGPAQANVRHPPVGAQAKIRVADYEEQEFYEEIIVDGDGAVKQKKFVIVSSQPERSQQSCPQNHRYEYIDDDKSNGRYGTLPVESRQKQVVNRYEYIPMQPQEEPPTARLHRYAVVPDDENVYALVPVEDLAKRVLNHRYDFIQNPNSPQIDRTRRIVSPQPQGKTNPVATQKLHDLLATPKKQHHQRVTPQSPPRRQTSPRYVVTPNKTTPPKLVRQNSKAQQKLNYALGTRQMAHDKRHTAIVAPICSSPVQSVYSETTFSQKSESWMNLSVSKPPVQATLAVASVMMILCGGVSSGLCFYMIAIISRQYFLDFGVVGAFTCLLLGFMGFRSRYSYFLPNRNYISGYIVLSVFSLLTCAGLLVLLFMRPKPGTPLADITSGAVCGISALSLFLAAVGLISSCCCKQPPPDNRVQHCARGFTV